MVKVCVMLFKVESYIFSYNMNAPLCLSVSLPSCNFQLLSSSSCPFRPRNRQVFDVTNYWAVFPYCHSKKSQFGIDLLKLSPSSCLCFWFSQCLHSFTCFKDPTKHKSDVCNLNVCMLGSHIYRFYEKNVCKAEVSNLLLAGQIWPATQCYLPLMGNQQAVFCSGINCTSTGILS